MTPMAARPSEPTWVEVHLGVFRENLRSLRRVLHRSVQLILVVKANAYGHGVAGIARAAARAGVRWFAVAHAAEVPAVRDAAPQADILVLGPIQPAEVPWVLQYRATPVVVDLEHGRALAAEARRRRRTLSVHLKVDTGMGRLGFHWAEAAESLRALQQEPGLRWTGVCTHFARVEAGPGDPASVQYERFMGVVRAAESMYGERLMRHASSSRAMLLHPEWDLDAVRPGLAAYGYGASDPAGRVITRPILEWKSRVAQVRRVPAGQPIGYYGTYVTPAPTHVAIVATGYADGYLRALSNRGHVLINGRRCRVVGRVSMNWVAADVGPYGTVRPGDEVVLIGRQGNQEIWADELATLCRTIPYEILTCIRATIPRHYVGS